MELDQLRQFVEVARAGSFSRAASSLGVSQPYLSQRVGSLEAELHRHLFLRTGRGVSLTDAGKRLYDTAIEVLEKLEVAAEIVPETDADLTGKITIGLPPSMIDPLCVRMIRKFAERFPKASLSIVEQLSSVLQDSLLANRVDVAFLFNPVLNGALDTTVVSTGSVCLIARRDTLIEPNLKLADSGYLADGIPFAGLSHVPLILPSHPHPLRAMVEMAASSQGAVLNIPYEVDGVDTILHLVDAGIASTVSTAPILRQRNPGSELVAVPLITPELTSVLCIATSAKRSRTVLMERTVALMGELGFS